MAEQTQTPVVKQTAGQFALNLRDYALGAVVAGATAGVQVIVEVVNAWLIEQGPIHFDWPQILKVSLMAAGGYLGKNFFTPPKTMIMAPKEYVTVSTTSSGKTVVTAQPGEVK